MLQTTTSERVGPRPLRVRREPIAAGAPGRLHELDLLRIGAALAVVFFHYTFSGPAQGWFDTSFPFIDRVSRFGYLGVDLFFMISGFVVLMSAWGRTPRQFVISRVIRLYPAYWVAVTLTTVTWLVFRQGDLDISPLRYLANLTMLNSPVGVANVDVVYWTLWTELRFYAIIFALAWFGITRRRVMWLLWGWLTLTVAVQVGLLPGFTDVVIQSQYSHYFIAGMALFLVYRFGADRALWALLTVSLGNAIFRGIGFAEDVGERYQEDFHPWMVIGSIVAMFAVMTLFALRLTEKLARPWFADLGAITYPLYLIHAYLGFTILSLFDGVVGPYPLLGGTVAFVMALAFVIHHVVERPAAPRLKRLLRG